MSTVIGLIYKAWYNYFVKKDGYNAFSHVLATACLALVFFCLAVNCSAIVCFLLDIKMQLPFSKGEVWIAFTGFIGCLYLLLFYCFKFSKNGDDASLLFSITPSHYSLIWKAIVANFLFTGVVAICSIAASYK